MNTPYIFHYGDKEQLSWLKPIRAGLPTVWVYTPLTDLRKHFKKAGHAGDELEREWQGNSDLHVIWFMKLWLLGRAVRPTSRTSAPLARLTPSASDREESVQH